MKNLKHLAFLIIIFPIIIGAKTQKIKFYDIAKIEDGKIILRTDKKARIKDDIKKSVSIENYDGVYILSADINLNGTTKRYNTRLKQVNNKLKIPVIVYAAGCSAGGEIPACVALDTTCGGKSACAPNETYHSDCMCSGKGIPCTSSDTGPEDIYTPIPSNEILAN